MKINLTSKIPLEEKLFLKNLVKSSVYSFKKFWYFKIEIIFIVKFLTYKNHNFSSVDDFLQAFLVKDRFCLTKKIIYKLFLKSILFLP